jgi:hypothetical protein
MGARWEDPRYQSSAGRFDDILDRVFPETGTARGRVSDPFTEARVRAMIDHPASGDPTSPVSAVGASRPAHPTRERSATGRGAHHLAAGIRRPAATGGAVPADRASHPLPDHGEDSRGMAASLTLALLALVIFIWFVTGCTSDPGESLWCAEDSCEVTP